MNIGILTINQNSRLVENEIGTGSITDLIEPKVCPLLVKWDMWSVGEIIPLDYFQCTQTADWCHWQPRMGRERQSSY